MKLNIGEAISKGIIGLKDNPIIFLPAGVMAFLFSFFNYFTINAYQEGEAPTALMEFTGHFSGYQFLVGFLLLMLIMTFIGCIIIKMLYDSVYGKPLLSTATEVATRRFIPVFMVGIVWFLIVAMGSVFFILPGVFLGNKLLFSGYFVLIENEGIFRSLSKSWNITSGNWWKVFGLSLIVSGILPFIIGIVVAPLPRLAESIADFAFYLIYSPWIYSVYLTAYLKLRSVPENSSDN